jgi:hypothetical protein
VLLKKITLEESRDLIKYLSQNRVAEFEGHGLKVKFYQEIPELKIPELPPDSSLIRDYQMES